VLFRSISIKWSEHWNYGGHDSGWIDFPAKLVYDGDELEQFVNEKRKKIQAVMECRKNREKEELKKSIERQQQKLEELNNNANSQH
jgi:hypothetical protein